MRSDVDKGKEQGDQERASSYNRTVERSPDHSKPRHGPSHPKPRSRSPIDERRRSADRNRKPPSYSRPGPSQRRSPSPRLPPRGYGPPPRGRSPGRGSRGHGPVRHHSPGYFPPPPPRHHSPNRGPPPRRPSPNRVPPPRRPSPNRGPPRHYSPNRGPPRQHSPNRGPQRHHSPNRGPPRHHSPNRGLPRHQSPNRGGPRPYSSPSHGSVRHRSPGSGNGREKSPGPRYHGEHRSPGYRGRQHSKDSYFNRSPQKPRSGSPIRPSTENRSPRRHSPPRYDIDKAYTEDPPFGEEKSPDEVPRVPRDQRTPPRILPPRPKYMRSPQQDLQIDQVKERKSSRSRSPVNHTSSAPRIERSGRLGSPKASNRSHQSRSSHKLDVPKPPSISRRSKSVSPRPSKHSSYTENVPDQNMYSKRDEVNREASLNDMALSNKSTGMSGDWAVFRGPEMDKIDTRELKKIQIDIRRSIAEHKIRDGPVFRNLTDPTKLIIPRRSDEGSKKIFDRDEILHHLLKDKDEKIDEQRVMIITEPLEEYERKLGNEISGGIDDFESVKKSPSERRHDDRGKKREKSPLREASPFEKRFRPRHEDLDAQFDEKADRVDIRTRLGGRERSPREMRDVRDRLGERHGDRGHVRERLGDQSDRWEAGRNIKSWDNEQDNTSRDGRYWDNEFRDDSWERDNRNHGQRGYFRGGRQFRGGRGRGGYFSYRGRGRRQDYGNRRSETDWKHDKYHQEEPSSTTD